MAESISAARRAQLTDYRERRLSVAEHVHSLAYWLQPARRSRSSSQRRLLITHNYSHASWRGRWLRLQPSRSSVDPSPLVDPALRLDRAEVRRLLIPSARLGRVGHRAEHAKLRQH